MENSPQPTEDILFDVSFRLVQAGPWKRFANYIVDRIVFGILSTGYSLVLLYSQVSWSIMGDDYSVSARLVRALISYLSFGFFMGLVEAVFKGKTLGKVFTGTRAVNEDGSPISPKTAFLRGLSRMVPFEPFSAFGNPSYPWHDRWTRTYVIDEKESSFS
ncbi:MAG TPA: RDD family protein [Puia sp.]